MERNQGLGSQALGFLHVGNSPLESVATPLNSTVFQRVHILSQLGYYLRPQRLFLM